MSLKKNLCGILFCAVIAVIATFLSSLKIGGFALELIGAPVMSILFGLLISFAVPSLPKKEDFRSAITFTSKKILQWAVIILGFSLDLSTVFFCGKQKPSCNNLYNFLIAHNGFYNDEAAEN